MRGYVVKTFDYMQTVQRERTVVQPCTADGGVGVAADSWTTAGLEARGRDEVVAGRTALSDGCRDTEPVIPTFCDLLRWGGRVFPRRVDETLARHPLRGADAVHLASAMLVHHVLQEQVTFACADVPLINAARADQVT